MSHNCENCGKPVKFPKGAEIPDHVYCDECRLGITKLILKQQAAARREIVQLNKRLYEVTEGGLRLSNGDVRRVLVYTGIAQLAELFGEEIQVIEMDEEEQFEWQFQFIHNEITYITYGRASDPEDRRIAEEWRTRHGTFH